ncbi:MAG: HD domain-containing protein, partial [Clostridia bacterium]
GDLYIVGGCVRNAFLNLSESDIDWTGSLTPTQVIEKVGNKFKIIADYASFGSLLIACGEEKFEYTTFREDSYLLDSHRPCEVKFTKNIEIDAKRRDFSCNAIYYKIDEKKIIDPLCGVKDIERRILKSCNGEKTFSEDGLRILRLIRQSGELGFEIDDDTMKYANKNVENLRGISKERIRDEFDKILACDFKYGNGDQQRLFNALELMRVLGVWEFVLPQMMLGYGMKQNPIYHEKDVYYHSLAVCCNCEKHLRLAGLLHDIAKPVVFLRDGVFHNHDIEGYALIKEILGQDGLKYPNAVVEKTARLSLNHMKDLKGELKLRKLKLFILQNYDIIDDIIKIKIADGKGCKTANCDSKPILRWVEVLKEMREKNLPFDLKNLKINGLDVLEIVGEENSKYISKILDKLQGLVIVEEIPNENERLKRKVSSVLIEVKNAE